MKQEDKHCHDITIQQGMY